MEDRPNIAPEPSTVQQDAPGRAPSRLSAADLAFILALHRAERSARSIAAELHRSPSAVAKAIRDGQRRASHAAVRSDQPGLVIEAKRRRDAARQARKRERDKASELAADAATRSAANRPSEIEYRVPGAFEPDETRRVSTGILTIAQPAEHERYVRDTLGNDLNVYAARPTSSSSLRSRTGEAAFLDRNDFAREARAASAAAGLEDGVAIARVLSEDGSTVLAQCTFRPLFLEDVKQAAFLTGLDPGDLAKAATSPDVARALARGIRVAPTPEPSDD